ncbi:MAG: hypothetical protein Q8S11_12005 [Daejeonella sp.]|uniref:metal-sulfur cluster assembly factor n=1 Tax=Daejeonella sp. TaxID=2805397 RepID=UPI0027349450|nr:hypothetical protein [Daejeonella sp.]MDP3469053.1 hypothetical protein [Daejeonella sp.]
MEIQNSSSAKQNSLSSQKNKYEYENSLIEIPSKLGIESDLQQPGIEAPIRRRRFLGLGFLGLTGLSLSSLSSFARNSENRVVKSIAKLVLSTKEESYWDRTDRFEEKMKLMQSAWERKDFKLVRSLTNSLRITGIQAQIEEEDPGMPLSGSSNFEEVDSLPLNWKAWASGWKYFKVLEIKELITIDRKAEPVEVLLAFSASQINSPFREIRVASIDNGILREVTSQVYDVIRRKGEWFCKLLFLADCLADKSKTFLIFFGNPDAELPKYLTDLSTKGEGVGLTIENNVYKAILSGQSGQLERMTVKHGHGIELYAGGEAHGELPGIDWAHDYVSEGFYQKFRITLWDECPDYEIVRGPICTIVRRWGFPYSPIHPVFSPSRLNMDIEYRFYASLPYFHKFGRMTSVKDFELVYARDDEWVFTGQPFTDTLWMGPDGKLKIGKVDPNFKDNLWGVGFFNKDTKDSFIGLFLEHYADGLPELVHSGTPEAHYDWALQLWSRSPLPVKKLPAGTVLHEKNAYLSVPFTYEDGPGMIEELRRKLMKPLFVSIGKLDKELVHVSPGKLARPGEAGDSPVSKKVIWDALQNCKDYELYKADISIVDLGLVYDISVQGDLVKIVLAMPHRGRPLGGFFTHVTSPIDPKIFNTIPDVLLKVPGVRDVVMEQTWYPAWSSNLLTETGRRKLNL